MAPGSFQVPIDKLSITDSPDHPRPPQLHPHDLVSRSIALLNELNLFESRLERKGKHDAAKEFRSFFHQVRSEVKSLEKLQLSKADFASEKLQHALKSSNLPFLEAVWSAAKRSYGLVAFNRRLYSAESSTQTKSPKFTTTRAAIDIISEHGSQWIKVSLITERRLLFELAETGWINDASSDDRDDVDDVENSPSSKPQGYHEDDGVSINKVARILVAESKNVRVKYRNPSILMSLPNLRLGKVREVDNVVDEIRKMGVHVQTADDVGATPKLDQVIDRLLTDESNEFSSVLNVDCTILLSLVSDISHINNPEQPWLNPTIKEQIKAEAKENLLPSILYPVLGSRELVCTREAAGRMRELVALIGTETEQRRTAILMGDDGAKRSKAELLAELGTLSCYPVPQNWNIPIRVVDKESTHARKLPLVASVVEARLSQEINKSVFLFGWLSGYTTITANAMVTKLIERTIEETRKSPADVGPDVWLCHVPRSLIGKQPRGYQKNQSSGI